MERSSYSPSATLTEYVEKEAREVPNLTAVTDEAGGALSYDGLMAAVNALSTTLSQQAPPRGMIGLLIERSVGMVVAILSVLKLGHAFVPLAPSLTTALCELILADTSAWAVLVSTSLRQQLSDPLPGVHVLLLDSIGSLASPYTHFAAADAAAAPTPPAQGWDLCYCCFTSGSTGKPRGVFVEHRNVTSQILWFKQLGLVQHGDTVLGLTQLTSGSQLIDTFLPLFCGGRLFIAASETQRLGVGKRQIPSSNLSYHPIPSHPSCVHLHPIWSAALPSPFPPKPPTVPLHPVLIKFDTSRPIRPIQSHPVPADPTQPHPAPFRLALHSPIQHQPIPIYQTHPVSSSPSDPARPDPTRPDPTRPNQTRPASLPPAVSRPA